ncbi:helix-turn-helix domain-containing protein [Companilactobacillus huachuanensis]|uniref:Helix-turn-helix domain-containing protein n=1 Tax=Companilactobacillus huachuanensis TaxID=2559914 RepID=A0ABW1RNL9_9LACO|nr:helix-turn-helix transcriptional regulator [Companilactobacillus huachuanensis]
MSLANNIVKYRKINELSQSQLAEALSISRQSISKWETGENLPSIDNLISLSGLLDISLDELITGEPYLHFPFNYGKPKNRWLIFLLLIPFILGILFYTSFNNFYMPVLGFAAAYFMLVFLTPFDFKRYYTYWSLGKKGITYTDNQKNTYDSLDEIKIPIKALLYMRKTQYVPYNQIKNIEVKLDLWDVNPESTILIFGFYTPNFGQYIRENFYFVLTTKDDQKIHLDLRQYYWPKSKERQMLSTIISFMKRKNIEFIDKQNIAEMVKDRSISLTKKLYELRDK